MEEVIKKPVEIEFGVWPSVPVAIVNQLVETPMSKRSFADFLQICS